MYALQPVKHQPRAPISLTIPAYILQEKQPGKETVRPQLPQAPYLPARLQELQSASSPARGSSRAKKLHQQRTPLRAALPHKALRTSMSRSSPQRQASSLHMLALSLQHQPHSQARPAAKRQGVRGLLLKSRSLTVLGSSRSR